MGILSHRLMQLVVLGMHRSGTSLLTSTLAGMGCNVGPDSVAEGPWNPRGHWEHPDVVALDDRVLAALGAAWHDVGRLDLARLDPEALLQFRSDAAAVVRSLDSHRPWVIKDPRLCWLLPLWRPLLECPVAILVHRDPIAVARSLQARDGFPLPFGVALWEDAMRRALAASSAIPRLLVSHAALVAAPQAAAEVLRGKLTELGVSGLHPRDGLEDWVDRNLVHHAEAAAAERSEWLNPLQIELSEALERGDLEAVPRRALSGGARDLLAAYLPQPRAERDQLLALLTIERELRAWVADLEGGKAWLEEQRSRWQAVAEGEARRGAELEARVGELLRRLQAVERRE